MTRGKVALFDVDDSLADYTGAIRRDLASLAGPGEKESPIFWGEGNPDYINNRINVIRQRPGWWEELKPLESGLIVLEEALRIGFDIHILTKSPRHMPYSRGEKDVWCKRHIEPLLPKGKELGITISDNKALVYGRVLFDDYTTYMDEWLEFRPRGLGIMPVLPRNESYEHSQVVRWDGNNLEEIRERLLQAYNRD